MFKQYMVILRYIQHRFLQKGCIQHFFQRLSPTTDARKAHDSLAAQDQNNFFSLIGDYLEKK
jgi:hypothetical protein